MKTRILLFCLLLTTLCGFSNDGAYYSSGNQLIPITETEISVNKEILSIERQGSQLLVHVYYEFFNPGEEKKLLVGFEAASPSDYYEEEDFKEITNHPFIYDFTVRINGKNIPYQVSHVKNKDYYSNGKINELSLKQAIQMGREYAEEEDGTYFYQIPYMFVYHFEAVFSKGTNIIEHTYAYHTNELVMNDYCFNYVLTAANRWANKQIDDFTLNLNLGERESFEIAENFFSGQKGWTINGKGRFKEIQREYEGMKLVFHIQKGQVSFHKMDFHPEGELFVCRPYYDFEDGYAAVDLQFDEYYASRYFKDADTQTKSILRNLPFAYRGYVFKTEQLQKYFESTDWYLADPDYDGKLEELSEMEREWVTFWKKQ